MSTNVKLLLLAGVGVGGFLLWQAHERRKALEAQLAALAKQERDPTLGQKLASMGAVACQGYLATKGVTPENSKAICGFAGGAAATGIDSGVKVVGDRFGGLFS